MEMFVPQISSFHKQAQQLRADHLRGILAKLEDKPQLQDVFVQVDELLDTLDRTLNDLRHNALAIRNSELKDRFQNFEHQQRGGAGAGAGEASSPEESSSAATEPVASSATETMMEVHVIGLSHHLAPVEVREKLAVDKSNWNRYAQELVEFSRTSSGYLVPEVAVLSTCNRFELYFSSQMLKRHPAIECVLAFLRMKSGLPQEELGQYLFENSGEDAVQHAFEVSSGLDSIVLGEGQILSQVKDSHQHCIQKGADGGDGSEEEVAGSGGKIVSRLMHAALKTGKMARSETQISKGSVSVSSAAVELLGLKAMLAIRKTAGSARICILGAGKMSRLLLIALFSKFPDADVTVVNRSVEKAQALLDDGEVKGRGGSKAKVAPMERALEVVAESDVVFAATGSREPILSGSDLAGRGGKALMLIDISVPRNIAEDCTQVEGAHLYSVDDLKEVMEANTRKRSAEIEKVRTIIDREGQKYREWQAAQGASPYLCALHTRIQNIREKQTQGLKKKLENLGKKSGEGGVLGAKELKALEQSIDRSIRRVTEELCEPVYYSLKEPEELEPKRSKLRALRSLFNLEPEYKRRRLPPSALQQQNQQ